MVSSKRTAAKLSKTILLTLLTGDVNRKSLLYPTGSVRVTISRLKRRGLLEDYLTDSGKELELTKQGRKLALKYSIQELKLRQTDWDGRWRFVIFDIPEKRKGERKALRSLLTELGFVNYQESVLIYPHNCEEEIEYIRCVLGIKEHVKYIEASKIDNAEKFTKKFNL